MIPFKATVREVRPPGLSWSDLRPKGGEILQRTAKAYVWKVVSLTPARPL